MSIDPLDRADRGRLSNSMDYWFQEHSRYRLHRRETISHYIGSTAWAEKWGARKARHLFGNLMQMSAQAHTITLAFGDPRYKVVPNVPIHPTLEAEIAAMLNRYSEVLNWGDKARAIALDSFFGYGIGRVGIGFLPPGAQQVTKLQTGPLFQRVSQDNYLFDGDAVEWDQVTWQADLFTVSRKDALQFKDFLDFNEEDTLALPSFAMRAAEADGRFQSSPTSHQQAMDMTRLIRVYLPYSGIEAWWGANDTKFSGVEGKPLLMRDWEGHHSGPYEVLSHLDIPDNLIPVAESESTKRLHVLFNELGDITSHQAISAKQHPVYEIGSQRDMKRLEETPDRLPVGVSDITKIGSWEKPGPTQSQTAYQMATLQLFKEFSGNLDDTLGLSPTAKTGVQSKLIRQATTARGAEKARRMDRFMENVALKIVHIALNSPSFRLPILGRFGKNRPIDLSWRPPNELPRHKNADDYQITLVPYTLARRDPEERLAQLNEANVEIFQAMQMKLQGAPLDIEEFIELQADYRDLPELRKMYAESLPEFRVSAENAGLSKPQRPGVGEYLRQNISSETNEGALVQNMTQGVAGDDPSQVRTVG